ncbi:hypothetical protein JCM10908_005158 [Rhodotorula pacifica]|uniref:tRNA dihydrouridine synthase n=1 Tax=Rhodotorula pacifica TaxID=1495444 RepID=UPI003176C014
MAATLVASSPSSPVRDPSTIEYDQPPTLEQLEPQPRGLEGKLEGHALWKEMGEPKYVVAPMVDQSELAWRILSRLHGANLCYTPMFHAASFATSPKHRQEAFDLSPSSLEGVAPYDRPLVVQFCANDKEHFLNAAKYVTDRCDAVDLNLGCPQGIAKRGHYGAFLMEEWNLIRSLISHLHQNLTIPIIAKIRVFPSLAKTLHYASHVYSSGAQLVTVHGRTREAKGPQTGLASWDKIRRVVELLSPRVPVLANGGIPSSEEIELCLEETGAKGVMSAEGNLYNPMLFAPLNAAAGRAYLAQLPEPMRSALQACEAELELSGAGWDRDRAAYAPSTFIAQQYLTIVATLPSTRTATSAIKAHLYKLFRPVWAAGRHSQMRESLGKAGGISGTMEHSERVKEFQVWLDEFRELIKADREAGLLPADSNRPLTHAEVQTLFGGVIPYSHCQPYLRVTMPAGSKEELELKAVDDAAKRKREVDELGAIDPEAEAKRTKPSPPSPPPSGPTTIPAAGEAVPAPSTFPCTTPSCTNAAAGKCSNRVCKTCCAALRAPPPLSSAEASTTPAAAPAPDATSSHLATTAHSTPATATTSHACEFHETKEAKERELAARRKEMQKLKRERGKLKARENNEKVKALNEQKRQERKAAAAETTAPE